MLQLISHDDGRRLREFFAEAHYTPEELRDKMALTELPSRRMRTLPRMLDRTRERTARNTLARWFYIGIPVEAKTAAELLPAWVLEICLESGMLTREGETYVPAVRLTPLEKLLIASDRALDIETAKRSDLVLWPNPSTRALFSFTVRKFSRATLDLGAGTGVQALLAAPHSQTVVATDLNARATEFAAFNARLNGFENIECLTGDSFAPVEGRTFDLIVANPPFFITPFSNYMYCNNTLELDDFCRSLVRGASRFLSDGGYCQMLCEWVQVPGQTWQERLTEWFEGTGCDVWVLKGSSTEAFSYGTDRFRETIPYSPETDEAIYNQWMDFYRERKIEGVHGGVIAMRRRSGQNWVRLDDMPGNVGAAFGDFVLQAFTNYDFLESHTTDEQMLGVKPKLSPSVVLDQQFQQSDKGWEQKSLKLRLAEGIPFSLALEPLVAEFVSHCDGKRTLGELIQALASKVNANSEQVQRECLSVVRRLIERGFLLAPSELT